MVKLLIYELWYLAAYTEVGDDMLKAVASKKALPLLLVEKNDSLVN